jgi:hypothetical protein
MAPGPPESSTSTRQRPHLASALPQDGRRIGVLKPFVACARGAIILPRRVLWCWSPRAACDDHGAYHNALDREPHGFPHVRASCETRKLRDRPRSTGRNRLTHCGGTSRSSRGARSARSARALRWQGTGLPLVGFEEPREVADDHDAPPSTTRNGKGAGGASRSTTRCSLVFRFSHVRRSCPALAQTRHPSTDDTHLPRVRYRTYAVPDSSIG